MSLSKKSFYTRYGDKRKISIKFEEETLTKQSFKDETDINNIVKQFNKTGLLPDMIKQNPKYGDFSDSSTYQESLNLVLFAQEQFNGLSSHIRERFNNDPAKFLEFASSEKNVEEMVKLGLATKNASNDQLDTKKEVLNTPNKTLSTSEKKQSEGNA